MLAGGGLTWMMVGALEADARAFIVGGVTSLLGIVFVEYLFARAVEMDKPEIITGRVEEPPE